MNLSKFYFRHSSIEKFESKEGAAVLIVKDVAGDGALVNFEELVTVTIVVEGYTLLQEHVGIEKNTFETITGFTMQSPDGEALNVTCSDEGFEALIEWNFYSPRKTITRNYKAQRKKVIVNISDPYPDER